MTSAKKMEVALNKQKQWLNSRQKLSQITLCLLFLVGLYAPTSVSGTIIGISHAVYMIFAIFCFFVLILLNGVGSRPVFLVSMLIPLVLTFATLISPLPELALGSGSFFAAITLLYMLNLRPVGQGQLLHVTFLMANLINVAIGVAVIFNVSAADRWLMDWYNDFYPDLLHNMVIWYNKPVLTFGTHSIAGLFMLIFMYVNLKTYESTQQQHYAVFALSFMAMLWFLQSVTSLLLLLIAVGYLLYIWRPHTHQDIRRWAMLIPAVFLLAVVAFLFTYQQVWAIVQENIETIWRVLTSPSGGFLARFSEQGILVNNLAFILENWYRPAGLRTTNGLFFGDSGPVEYMVRGSFVLLAGIYAGLLLFLFRNMRSQHSAFFLFSILLIAEIGYTHLKYFRLVSVLPFLIAYLNALLPPQRQVAS